MENNPRVPYRMASERPSLVPPDGKPLIVYVNINVEYVPFDKPIPRKLLSTPHGLAPVPDVPNFSWFEYGHRCGMPRILNLLVERDLPVTVNLMSRVIDGYPALAEAMLSAGWSFVAHGTIHRQLIAFDDERAVIDDCLDSIERFSGTRPRGWFGPGLAQSFDTPDHLAEAGVEYVMDWVLDDLPCWMSTRHGPLISVPYTLELSDVVVFSVEQHNGDDVVRRLERTLETFDRELQSQPRVLTLPIHPHILGVPHRFPYLVHMLDILAARDDVIFLTADEIADWYRNAESV
jgi:allantoinase